MRLGERVKEDLLRARVLLAGLLFAALLLSWSVLASSHVYWTVIWRDGTLQPAPPNTVVLSDHGRRRYVRLDQYERWRAWESSGWRWTGVSGVACVFGAALINCHYLLPDKLLTKVRRRLISDTPSETPPGRPVPASSGSGPTLPA